MKARHPPRPTARRDASDGLPHFPRTIDEENILCDFDIPSRLGRLQPSPKFSLHIWLAQPPISMRDSPRYDILDLSGE
jgi:hypothetical protein